MRRRHPAFVPGPWPLPAPGPAHSKFADRDRRQTTDGWREPDPTDPRAGDAAGIIHRGQKFDNLPRRLALCIVIV